ncbi:DUF4270 family protein [Flavobacterium sp.]|uniref:DUF4270 family protein n=1 Tax=Flavobacterium sp. TaxID=239 RepID=UPI002623A679|nr:DUF4270 family protein [Flavobacterium sp.]
MRIIFFYFLLLLFVSCATDEVPDFLSPSDSFVDSRLKLELIDTFSLKVSTYKLDSISTVNGFRILQGKYSDPIFGVVTARGFFELKCEGYYIEEEAVLDSVVLNLAYDKIFYNDTTLIKSIQVHQLSKNFRPRSNSNSFFNTSDLQVGNFLGSRTFKPTTSDDSLKVSLNHPIFNSIFQQVKNGQINNQSELTNIFKGIRISPAETDDNSITSFKVQSSYIRLYYSLPDEPDEVLTFDLNFNDLESNKYFTQITSERTGTNMANLTNQETEAASTASQNYSYMQSGIGIVTKVSFPNFRSSIFNLNTDGYLLKSELKIKLEEEFISENRFTPDSLMLYIIDQNNNFLATLNEPSGKAVVGYISKPSPDISEYYLTVNVNPFLIKTLENNQYLNYSLALIPFDFNVSASRLVLNGEKHPTNPAKVNVTYLRYND